MFKRIFLAVTLAFASPAAAQILTDAAQAEILPGWREADGLHVAGLSIRLAPGWKTYWRAPGEGGIPPQFNWSGSQNLASVEVRYPAPKVMYSNGISSIGYDEDVVFPLLVSAQDSLRPIRLRGEIDIGVCEEICIPMTLEVAGDLPTDGAYDVSISAVLKDQPKDGGAITCIIEPIADGLRLRTETQVQPRNGDVAIVEAGEPGVWVSPPVMTRVGGNLVTEVELVAPTAKPFALARSEVRLTVIGRGGVVEMLGCD